ncbi:MAG: carbohydrate kinase family protein [Candidatus Nanoarchaeia archaeon]|nr:carbohydrate kinase family protein [Candidatus Nanoarchaeia archaeon]MDD5741071.1 carbohydrate kinase family protein [Candidatus Nanoarchaeia archaeon]
MKFDIVTFGSAVIDVFVNTDVFEKHGFMHYPIGEKILIKELRFDWGGAGTNTAVAFSRLGFKTGCISELGLDENGKKIFDSLKKEKVEFLGKVVKGELSGYSVILDSSGGERTILTYKGASNEISLRDIKKFKTKWLYLSSLGGMSFETQKRLAFILKKQGVKIAFNPSSYLIKKENLSSLLKITDILVLNKQEAQMLTRSKINLLENLIKLGPKIAVITDKDKMITCYDGHNRYFLIPNKVKVVERTGAGDAFASGFVAGQIAGKSIKYSLRLGLAESENVIRYFGAKNRLLRMRLRK